MAMVAVVDREGKAERSRKSSRKYRLYLFQDLMTFDRIWACETGVKWTQEYLYYLRENENRNR